MIDDITRVACVGSGLVGQSWAALLALKGYQVKLQDISEEKLAEAVKRIGHHIDVLVDAGLGTEPEAAKQRITTTTSLEEALDGVQFVIESVYESLEVKCPLHAKMDELAPADVIFASSTSGYMMSEIGRD